LSSVYPNLAGTNAAVSGDILSKLGGTLSPGTENALKNAQATFGQTSGMPNSGLSWNSLYGNIAGASEAQQQQGIQDYNNTVGAVSQTQTPNQGVQAEVGIQNALDASAPDPTAAASYAEQLYNKYLGKMGSPAGGTGALGFGAPVSTATPSAGGGWGSLFATGSGQGPQTYGGMADIPTGNALGNTSPSGWDDLSDVSFPQGYDPFAPAGSGGLWGEPQPAGGGFDWGSLGGTVDDSGG
jgi:hypothetical protein